jgi:hypothetical protein
VPCIREVCDGSAHICLSAVQQGRPDQGLLAVQQRVDAADRTRLVARIFGCRHELVATRSFQRIDRTLAGTIVNFLVRRVALIRVHDLGDCRLKIRQGGQRRLLIVHRLSPYCRRESGPGQQ